MILSTQIPAFTTGRKKIFCYEDNITAGNVINVVKNALPTHNENVREIEWLFALYRGNDNIIENRTRQGVNGEINYKAFVSYYSLIADYATNLFLQNPTVYVNADGEEHVSNGIRELGKIHRAINRYARDKTTSYHVDICGVGYRFIEQDNRTGIKDSVLAPTSCFSIYGDDTDDIAMARVYITTIKDEQNRLIEDVTGQTGSTLINTKKRYTVYTDEWIFTWVDGDEQPEVKPAMPWGCPIVEYKKNPFYIGSFERVTSLIHLLSVLRSDGVNGVVQSIAGIILGKNVGLPLPDASDSEAGRKEKEEIIEQFRADLKDRRELWVQDNNSDAPVSIEYIATELYNADVDVLYQGILNDIITITRTPNSVVNLGASGNKGAADVASGTDQALENAKNGEPYWFESTREHTYIDLEILHYKGELENLNIGDLDFALQRSVAVDPVSSSTAYATYISSGVKPSDAARLAKLTPDPEEWEKRVLEYRLEEEERRLEYARREKEVTGETTETITAD